MSLREHLEKNPAIGIAFAASAVLAVIVIGVAQSRPPVAERRPGVYYTNDDGKSLFTDELGKPTPFDHQGRPAVRAYVFSPDGGKTRIVGYLEKHAPALREQLIAAGTDKLKQGNALFAAGPAGVFIKRPGDANWVSSEDPAAQAIRVVKSPDGRPLEAVLSDGN